MFQAASDRTVYDHEARKVLLAKELDKAPDRIVPPVAQPVGV